MYQHRWRYLLITLLLAGVLASCGAATPAQSAAPGSTAAAPQPGTAQPTAAPYKY